MPTQRDTIFSFSCDICFAEFSAIDQKYAYSYAKECENAGTPQIHTFKEGIFTADLKTPVGYWDKRTFQILRLFFEKRTHRPKYNVKMIKPGTHCREGEIFDVYGEDIRQTIINKIVHIGCRETANDTSY